MLPKKKRVTTELFQKVLKEGNSLFTPSLSFKFIRKTTPELSRFSVFVPKKVLKLASKRNYLKRKINAALKTVYPSVHSPVVGVIYAKNSTIPLSVKQITEELKEIFRRAKIIT